MALMAELVNPREHPSFHFPAPHAGDQGRKTERKIERQTESQEEMKKHGKTERQKDSKPGRKESGRLLIRITPGDTSEGGYA